MTLAPNEVVPPTDKLDKPVIAELICALLVIVRA